MIIKNEKSEIKFVINQEEKFKVGKTIGDLDIRINNKKEKINVKTSVYLKIIDFDRFSSFLKEIWPYYSFSWRPEDSNEDNVILIERQNGKKLKPFDVILVFNEPSSENENKKENPNSIKHIILQDCYFTDNSIDAITSMLINKEIEPVTFKSNKISIIY